MSEPFISVIITAHNRQEFLRGAVQSVIDQDLPPDNFEIIIVKNFPDTVLDSMNSPRFHVVNVGVTNVGKSLLVGISKSRGKVISFLDDDDRFDVTKLKEIYSLFSNRKTLVYYHNYQRVVNQDGDLISNHGGPFSGEFEASDFIDNLKSISRKYSSREIYFNLSSCAIRKDTLMGYLDKLRKITGHTDDFFFYAALDSKGLLIFDSKPLTIYRNHRSTSKINKGRLTMRTLSRERAELYRNQAFSSSLILDMLTDPSLRRYVATQKVKEEILLTHYSTQNHADCVSHRFKSILGLLRYDFGSYTARVIRICYYLFISIF